MIRFSMDSNIAIKLTRKGAERIVARLATISSTDMGISTVVAHELFWGAFHSQHVAQNLASAKVFLAQFQILPFDTADALEAGKVRAELAAIGKPIGPFDTLIAGQARARNLIVVTNNVGEFSRVEGLAVEDWSV